MLNTKLWPPGRTEQLTPDAALDLSACRHSLPAAAAAPYPAAKPPVSAATVIGMNMTVSSEIYYFVRRLLKLGTKAIV